MKYVSFKELVMLFNLPRKMFPVRNLGYSIAKILGLVSTYLCTE